MRWLPRLRPSLPRPVARSSGATRSTTPSYCVGCDADAARTLGRLWRPLAPPPGCKGLGRFLAGGRWSEAPPQASPTPCRWFGQPARRGEPLSRDWLAQLWVEDKSGRSGFPRGRGRRRKQAAGRVGEAVEAEEATTWGSLLSSLRRSFLSGQSPVRHVENGSASGGSRPPPLSQHGGGVLSPGSPEKVKVSTLYAITNLLGRANLVITRDIEWANVMFAFEQESRYIIADASYPGAPVGFIREQSNVIYRQLFRSRRPFTAYITDAWGNEIFRVRRPFWWINSTIYAEVNGEEIGVVHRRWHLWRRIYDLYLGNKQFAVVENPGFWNWTFTLKDNNENVLAEINRDWRGVGLELFTDAGQYVIRFGHTGSCTKPGAYTNIEKLDVFRPLTLSERIIAVALAVSLDCDYFSRSRGWGLPIVFLGE